METTFASLTTVEKIVVDSVSLREISSAKIRPRYAETLTTESTVAPTVFQMKIKSVMQQAP